MRASRRRRTPANASTIGPGSSARPDGDTFAFTLNKNDGVFSKDPARFREFVRDFL
jgi:hypothetical protein